MMTLRAAVRRWFPLRGRMRSTSGIRAATKARKTPETKLDPAILFYYILLLNQFLKNEINE